VQATSIPKDKDLFLEQQKKILVGKFKVLREHSPRLKKLFGAT